MHHCCDAWDLETPGRIVMKRVIDKEKIDYDTSACFERVNSKQSKEYNKANTSYFNQKDNISTNQMNNIQKSQSIKRKNNTKNYEYNSMAPYNQSQSKYLK